MEWIRLELVELMRSYSDLMGGILYTGIFLLGIIVVYTFLALRGPKNLTDPTKADLIWLDEGRSTKPFFNQTYKVLGKPDAMYNDRGYITAVEYKSRRGRIHASDITQAKAAALAARGNGYQVKAVMVKTKTTQQVISLPAADTALYDEISDAVEMARTIKQGAKARSAKPELRKCASCAYNASCSDRAA